MHHTANTSYNSHPSIVQVQKPRQVGDPYPKHTEYRYITKWEQGCQKCQVYGEQAPQRILNTSVTTTFAQDFSKLEVQQSTKPGHTPHPGNNKDCSCPVVLIIACLPEPYTGVFLLVNLKNTFSWSCSLAFLAICHLKHTPETSKTLSLALYLTDYYSGY